MLGVDRGGQERLRSVQIRQRSMNDGRMDESGVGWVIFLLEEER